MNYSVGQVLYVVFKKDQKVVPVRVIEEITRKTLEGLKIDYVVQVGQSVDDTISLVTLQREGEIFNTPEETIEELCDRARRSITKLVNIAEKKSMEWYGVTNRTVSVVVDKNDEEVALSKDATSDDRIRVVLPDGTVAMAKLPEVMNA